MSSIKWPLLICPVLLTGCFSEAPDRAVEACAAAMKALGEMPNNKEKDATIYKPSVEGKRVSFLLKEDKEYVDAACIFEFKRKPEEKEKSFRLSGLLLDGMVNDLSDGPSNMVESIRKALADGGFEKIEPKQTKLSAD